MPEDPAADYSDVSLPENCFIFNESSRADSPRFSGDGARLERGGGVRGDLSSDNPGLTTGTMT